MAPGIPGDAGTGADLAGHLENHGESGEIPESRALLQAGVSESAGTAFLEPGGELRAGSAPGGGDQLSVGAVFVACISFVDERIGLRAVDSAGRSGARVLFLGLDFGPLRAQPSQAYAADRDHGAAVSAAGGDHA